MKLKRISILTPTHQNEDNIEKLIFDIYHYVVYPLKKKSIASEVIIAEDGSTDNTRILLERNQTKYKYRLLSGKKKLGYIKAVKNLFSKANGELIFFLDSDGEINPKSFWQLFALWQKGNYDIVTAFKLNRKPLYRFIISRINNLLLRILFHTKIRDANAGFRLMKKEVGKELVQASGYLHSNFNAELIIRAVKENISIAEVAVPHFERNSVAFKPQKLVKILIMAFLELFRFRWYLKSTKEASYHSKRI